MRFEASCPRCRATVRAVVRAGPSGACRIGAMELRCPACGAVARAGAAGGRVTAPA